MTTVFDAHGVRFEYPESWELEVNEDGPRVTLMIQTPDSPGFALVSIDASCPDAEEMAEEALEAMRAEYPDLDATPVIEDIDGSQAVGYDAEFLSFDMPSLCAIRCLATPRRAILIFQQWSDLDESTIGDQMRTIRRTLEETDS